MIRNRLALLGAVLVGCGLCWTFVPGRIEAAQQDATAGAETSPPVKQDRKGIKSDPGAEAYAKNCAICHGDEREGNLPGFPPLSGVTHRMSDQQITQLIHAGKGRMPAFPHLQGAELSGLLKYMATPAATVANAASEGKLTGQAAAGQALFHQNCAFCHGRDAMGGESGPDLTQSKLVLADKNGDKISQVVREGRVEPKMPSFNFSSQEMGSIVAFIHARVKAAAEHPGGRRGVTVADLQTGNVDKGKAYFNGAGGCSKCHSPSGDLAGLASRLQGLQLEERMLYPRGARGKVTVTLPNGETVKGTEAYQDEFVIALQDAKGAYRSWRKDRVKFSVESPAEAHVEQFPKYTDDDIHNLMAYLQTLK